MTRCAVLGSPISHSLSPVLHRAAYRELGLTGWSYDAIEVAEDQLSDLLWGLDDSWRGLSLTMPLKQAVLPLLDSVSPTAEAAGAVNTVLLGQGFRVGDNTDVPGAVAAIRERTDRELPRATILGAGATASSMGQALIELGCRTITVLARDQDRAAATARRLAESGRAGVAIGPLTDPGGQPPTDVPDVLVSTIPAAAQTPELIRRFEGAQTVFDVIYDPWPTPLTASLVADRTLVTGLDLLIHQAALQVGLMAELSQVPVAAMRRAAEEELARRSTSG